MYQWEPKSVAFKQQITVKPSPKQHPAGPKVGLWLHKFVVPDFGMLCSRSWLRREQSCTQTTSLSDGASYTWRQVVGLHVFLCGGSWGSRHWFIFKDAMDDKYYSFEISNPSFDNCKRRREHRPQYISHNRPIVRPMFTCHHVTYSGYFVI